MGDIVAFAADGRQAEGYLALPAGGGPGIVVIQEWWGLVDHIKDLCDRFAAEGFVALAPDLYHGAATTEPDEAMKNLMALRIEEAAQDMAGAAHYLRGREEVSPKKLGAVGFCVGGNLALLLASKEPIDVVSAFYPGPRTQVDGSAIRGAVQVHLAEHDREETRLAGKRVVDEALANGLPAELHTYPGTHHAFFNDTRTETYDVTAARTAWDRTLAFFRTHLT